jgi:hypothetical protein
MTEAPHETNRESRSWWLTLPGMLSALAGVITAVTGLVVALTQLTGGGGSATPVAAPSGPAGALSSVSTGTLPGPTGSYTAAFPAGAKATVEGAVYELLGANVEVRNPGELGLRLSVRMTNNGPYPANFWDRSFRLRVDGVPRAPVGGLDELVDGQSAKEGVVEFVIPEAARRLSLLVATVSLPIVLTRRT